MKDGWREQIDLDILRHQSDALTSKDTCLDALKVIIIFVGVFPSSYECHTWKKKWGKKGLYTKVSRPHLSDPEFHADLGTMFQAELKTFNSQKCYLPKWKAIFQLKERQLGKVQEKRSEDSLYINQLLENNMSMSQVNTNQAHMDWISLEILLGSKLKGWREGGVRIS